MPNNFDLSNLALQALCPNNEILYDDKGLPSIMVKIPKQSYADLGLGSSTAIHPAWIVNGQEVDAIYISKYQNIVQNGRAYSLPGQDPKANINFDSARSACEAKGSGWHLMTRAEWAAIALWCKNNGTQPKGNNNYGKDTADSVYQAIPSMERDSSNRIQRVATGTGPLSWSHDGTPSGIWDLNGNVSEWVGGLRTVYGEIQILANNNAADSDKSQSATSAEWKAISATDGSLLTPNGTGTTTDSVKMRWDTNHWKLTSDSTSDGTDTYKNCTLESIVADASIGTNATLMLQALGLLKYDNTAGAYNGDQIYADSSKEERSFYCGGYWSNGAVAGVFFAVGDYARTNAGAGIGFRSAYCKLPAVS